MPQVAMDYWNGIDWINLTATLLVGIVIGWIGRRYYTWWSFWSETTRTAVAIAQRDEAARRYRDILSFKFDSNVLTLYVGRKILVMFVLNTLLIATTGYITLFSIERGEHFGFDQLKVPDVLGVSIFYVGTVILYFSAIGGWTSELWRTTKDYRNFEAFKAKVGEKLSPEEMKEIEREVKSSARK